MRCGKLDRSRTSAPLPARMPASWRLDACKATPRGDFERLRSCLSTRETRRHKNFSTIESGRRVRRRSRLRLQCERGLAERDRLRGTSARKGLLARCTGAHPPWRRARPPTFVAMALGARPGPLAPWGGARATSDRVRESIVHRPGRNLQNRWRICRPREAIPSLGLSQACDMAPRRRGEAEMQVGRRFPAQSRALCAGGPSLRLGIHHAVSAAADPLDEIAAGAELLAA
jgi:hypothetical protein